MFCGKRVREKCCLRNGAPAILRSAAPGRVILVIRADVFPLVIVGVDAAIAVVGGDFGGDDGFYSMGKLRFPCCRSRQIEPALLTVR